MCSIGNYLPINNWSINIYIVLCYAYRWNNLSYVQRQIAVTAYLQSKQLQLFVFELQDSLLPSSTGILTAEQRQTAVTAYLQSKQLLLFVFAIEANFLFSPSTM